MKDYWECPRCGNKTHEIYLKCDCGYHMTREQISNQVKERQLLEQRQAAEVLRQQKKQQAALAAARQRQEYLNSLKIKKENLKLSLQKNSVELKTMLDSALISQEEHDERRKVLLDKYFAENEKLSKIIEESEQNLLFDNDAISAQGQEAQVSDNTHTSVNPPIERDISSGHVNIISPQTGGTEIGTRAQTFKQGALKTSPNGTTLRQLPESKKRQGSFVSIFVGSFLTLVIYKVLNTNGVYFGFIPAVLVFGGCYWIARIIFMKKNT